MTETTMNMQLNNKIKNENSLFYQIITVAFYSPIKLVATIVNRNITQPVAQ